MNIANISTIHRYDAEMSFPDWKRPPRKKDMDILIRAFEGKNEIITSLSIPSTYYERLFCKKVLFAAFL